MCVAGSDIFYYAVAKPASTYMHIYMLICSPWSSFIKMIYLYSILEQDKNKCNFCVPCALWSSLELKWLCPQHSRLHPVCLSRPASGPHPEHPRWAAWTVLSAAFFFFVRALVSLTRASCSGLWASGREWGKEKKIRLGIFSPDKTILSRGTSGPTPGDAWPPIIARTLVPAQDAIEVDNRRGNETVITWRIFAIVNYINDLIIIKDLHLNQWHLNYSWPRRKLSFKSLQSRFKLLRMSWPRWKPSVMLLVWRSRSW